MSGHVDRLLASFLKYLENNSFEGKPAGLYEAKNYLASLGGKRARPIALMAAAEAANGTIETALPAAWAFEMFHNFTLAHDDIMDRAVMRRGKPALHDQYDEATAILAGDNMMLFVYQRLMNNYPNEVSIPLMKLVTQTGIEICEGQFMDMEFEKLKRVKEDSYLHMIKLKTAVLLGACLKAGGIVAGADEQDLEYLYDLGLNLGIGFQIKDDLMDAFSDNPKLGKVKGGDIMSNKKTILYIKALELANEQQGLELKEWFSKEVANNSEKVQAVLALFRTLKVEENVEAMMNTYYHKAYQDLQKLSFNNQKMEPLQAFVGFLAGREH